MLMKRSLHFLFFFSLFCVLAMGHTMVWGQQEQEAGLPPEEYRAWRDPETERLYWNKHLPVYLLLSPNPSGEDFHILKSESMPKYGTPFYFDTEGRNFMRTRWAVDPDSKKAVVPQREILWEVYADGLAPQTSIRVSDHKGVMTSNRYLGEGAAFTLSSKDYMSGVKTIYYSLNGVPFQPYNEQIALVKEGQNEIRYCAEDRVGNRETVRTQVLNFDVTPPQTRSEIIGLVLGNDNTVTPYTQINLTATDALSGVISTFYRIDKGAWHTYIPKLKISLRELADGAHTLEYYSVDKTDNKEEYQTISFYVDAIPPITISDILGDKFLVGDKLYFSSRTKMKITAVDNHSGVKEVRYSIDGGEFNVYSEPFYMPNIQGWHTVKYYSVDSTDNATTTIDGAGLYEYRMKIDKVFVDLTGPTIEYQIRGMKYARNDTTFIASTSEIRLSGSDGESGLHHLAYAIDKDPWEKEYSAPFDLEGLASGRHDIEYFGYDNVGNRNVKSFMVIVDSDAPTASYYLSVQGYPNEKDAEGKPVYPLDATIYLSAQDNMTGVAKLQYSLNGKPLQDYKQPFRGLEKGRNRLKIVVTDFVGNKKEYLEQFEVR